MTTVDDLKASREFDAAGRLAFSQGKPRAYGCHFGLRSNRGEAEIAFYAGYDAAKRDAAKPKTATNIKNLPDGEYFTEVGHSQRYPYKVVKRTEKTVTLCRVNVDLDPEFKPVFYVGGFAAHCSNQSEQTHLFRDFDDRYKITVRLGKNGWRKDGVLYRENMAVYFYDYNF